MTDTLTATDEWIARHGDRYEPPVQSQTVKRDYGRLRPWYETMALKGGLRPEHAMAARDLDMYWHVVNDSRGVCASYGDQRWNGTPIGQTSAYKLLGPEWRETCRARLADAKSIANAREWDYLMSCIEGNDTFASIGRQRGCKPETVARIVRAVLHRLSIHWGYFRGFGDP